jgi:hypothetical protein
MAIGNQSSTFNIGQIRQKPSPSPGKILQGLHIVFLGIVVKDHFYAGHPSKQFQIPINRGSDVLAHGDNHDKPGSPKRYGQTDPKITAALAYHLTKTNT